MCDKRSLLQLERNIRPHHSILPQPLNHPSHPTKSKPTSPETDMISSHPLLIAVITLNSDSENIMEYVYEQ